METITLTKEIKEFINSKNNNIHYDDVLKEIGLINCKNINKSTINLNIDEIIFTKNDIKEFCKKYNLISGHLKNFIDIIPTKNIQDIKNYLQKYPIKDYIRFKNLYGDILEIPYKTKEEILSNFKPDFFQLGHDFYNCKELYEKVGKLTINNKKYKGVLTILNKEYRKRDFIIIAPQNYFNLENSTIKDYEIIPDDPAIFEILDNDKYRLITCWGKEANTIELQNPILN